MKMFDINEEANREVLLEKRTLSSEDEEELQNLTFYGMEPGSDRHNRMVKFLRRKKISNPELYNKIVNGD